MLSKKSQYAFKALIYLAGKYDKGPVLISEIAKKKQRVEIRCYRMDRA